MITPSEAREIVRIALARGWCTKPGIMSADEAALEATAKPGRKTGAELTRRWRKVVTFEPPAPPTLPESPDPNGHRVAQPLPPPQPGGTPWEQQPEAVKEELTDRAEAAVEKKSCPKCGWPRVPLDRKVCNHCGGEY